MSSLVPWHRVRLATGVALALLAGVLLAPSAARAACGDYVVVGASQGPGHAAPMPAAPAQPTAPCSGPHCSRAPLAPPAAPVAPVSAADQEWACVAETAPAARREPFSYRTDDDPPRPSRHGDSVYHPPR